MSYLTRLTDDLFDVSRITRDKLTLQKESANLIDIIKAAVESSRPLIDLRQHRLTLNMPTEPIYVDGDRVRLTQVFMNLLNNSAKYTPIPVISSLTSNFSTTPSWSELKIPGSVLPRKICRIFSSCSTKLTGRIRAQKAGLGLGLTLVHRLVEMHGGIVEVRSEGANRGSEFIVRLTDDIDPRRRNSRLAKGTPPDRDHSRRRPACSGCRRFPGIRRHPGAFVTPRWQ